MQEIRQKYQSPSIANQVRKSVNECQTCVHDKRINNSQITPEIISIPAWDLEPEDIMHIDLLQELPPSVGYENIITAIQFFSRYAFAYPIQTYICQYSKSHYGYHDRTCLSTSIKDNRRRVSFCLKRVTKNSWHPRYYTKPCNHETHTNYGSRKK